MSDELQAAWESAAVEAWEKAKGIYSARDGFEAGWKAARAALDTPCCLDNTHTTHYSDGYTVRCKIHDTEHTTDTGWNR